MDRALEQPLRLEVGQSGRSQAAAHEQVGQSGRSQVATHEVGQSGRSQAATHEGPEIEPSKSLAVRPLAFEPIYREYFPFVWRNVRRIVGGSAAVDDIVQDVFVVIHARLPSYEGRGSLRSWVYGITRRVINDHRRTRRRHPDYQVPGDPTELDAFIDESARTPDAHAESAAKVRRLFTLLNRMEPLQRELLILVELEDLSAPEIAEILEIPLNTVYSRIHAARKEFQAQLRRDEARSR